MRLVRLFLLSCDSYRFQTSAARKCNSSIHCTIRDYNRLYASAAFECLSSNLCYTIRNLD